MAEDWNGGHVGRRKNKGELSQEWNCKIIIDRFSLFSIMDECCSLFGFEKIGTFTVTIGKTRNTCYRLEKGPRIQIKELNEESRRKIQDYFVFRWVFCLPIKHVYSRGEHIVEEFTTPRIKNEGLEEEEWFADSTKDSIKRFLNGRGFDFVAREILKVIIRVNKEAVIYYSEIKSRLMPY